MPDDFDPADPAQVAPMTSLVRAEIRRLVDRWEEADRRFLEARLKAVNGELTRAELDRWEAQGDYFGCSQELGSLLVLLLRHALKRQPDVLRALLVEALKPELEEIWEDVARLQHQRRRA